MNDANLWITGIAVVGVLLAMCYGLYATYKRLEKKEQGFGPNSLKAIGVVLFLPILFFWQC